MTFHCCSCHSAAFEADGLAALGLPLGLSSVVLLDRWWAVAACPPPSPNPSSNVGCRWMIKSGNLTALHPSPDPSGWFSLKAENTTFPLSSQIHWVCIFHNKLPLKKKIRIRMHLMFCTLLLVNATPPARPISPFGFNWVLSVAFISVCTWLTYTAADYQVSCSMSERYDKLNMLCITHCTHL